MIKIEKLGANVVKVPVTYKLTCGHCGCVFTFTGDDIKTRERTLHGNATIDCPFCHDTIVFKPEDAENAYVQDFSAQVRTFLGEQDKHE